MKIRSLTLFSELGYPPNRLLLEHLGVFSRHAKAVFEEAGFTLETVRLATPPFPLWLPPQIAPVAAQDLAIEVSAVGVDYLSLGPALPEYPESYACIPEMIAKTQSVFATGMLTDKNRAVDLRATKAAAKVIVELSKIEPNGFGNLFFSALANVKPYGPFFPTGFSEPGAPSFALAIEGASLALEAFSQAETLEDARQSLIRQVESQAAQLSTLCRKLESIYQYQFRGLDFTLAPHPDANASIGSALEALGLPSFGLAGSLAASAFITDTLDRGQYKRTGFNGLMLPILEDSKLAERSKDGVIDLNTLLLCSAVCGTGLDVVPLPGTTTAKALFPVLLDMAALALRLDKQLTARLMPIPGKTAGELTNFDFAYFANGAVMPLKSEGLGKLLSSAEKLSLQPKYPH